MIVSSDVCTGGGGGVTADQAEVAALLAEENVEVLTQEEADRLTQLDALTVRSRCSPHPSADRNPVLTT